MIDLVLIGGERHGEWPLGRVWHVGRKAGEIADFIEYYRLATGSQACLFWDASLKWPDADTVEKVIALPGDVWHAGLKLGMRGLPGTLDFVDPNWVLNVEPADDNVATSWRLSLQACLIRTDVLRVLGGCDRGYETLAGASLDMGFRFIKRGAFVRYVPTLVPDETQPGPQVLSIHDELLLVRKYFGKRWLGWAAFRAVMTGYPVKPVLRSFFRLYDAGLQPLTGIYRQPSVLEQPFEPEDWHDRVTILIPTLERYSYLRNELLQLRRQTVRPLEIMIMDQTPVDERDSGFVDEFSDLPLRVFFQDRMGQCTGWNQGLLASKGEFILFLGDDADHIAPDFLERFLRTLQVYKADMAASLVDEAGVDPIPPELVFTRMADGFPITMVTRELLEKSGLMDYAFDRGKLADQDLCIRCLQNGALMVFNPEIRVFHHRAPRGGLRKHKVRVITRASSRKSLFQRQLPSVTEIYIGRRYYSPRQQRERLWIRIMGTFSVQGGGFQKTLKLLIGIGMLPHTLWQTGKAMKMAGDMLSEYPQIPNFGEG